MKSKIETLIKEFVSSYHTIKNMKTKWREPIVAYADPKDKMFFELKEIVSPSHALPQDFLEDVQTVVSYFIPLDYDIVKSNITGMESSREWAISYVETSSLIIDLNNFIENELEKLGYDSINLAGSYNFDENKLINDWSHKHVAYVTGLGKFGLNHVLITDKGCCGYLGTFVTNLKIEPTERKDIEYCLYKNNNSCKKCIERCINGALKIGSFNRNKCYEACTNNAKKYSDVGSCTVCGKCLVNLPCSLTNPVKV